MALSRLTSEAERHSLKIATRRTIQMCGGQETAATITRVGRNTLSDYVNTANPRHLDTYMPVDVFADLIKDCAQSGEVAPLLQRLCELAGGRFVPGHRGGKVDLIDGLLRDLMTLREQVQAGEADE